MRHGKKFNHLGRIPSHRKAMLSNMASSLIMEKRISTTVAKAKALRMYVEPLLTKSKTDDTNSRRVVFSYLQDKDSVSELFNEVAEKIADRPGGYTRILKTGNRLGDNADMCIIELVDYNEALLAEAKPAKAKTRRSRRGKGGSSDKPKATETTTAAVEEAVVVEEAPAETTEDVATEEAAPEAAVEEVVEETPKTEAPEAEAKTEEAPEATTEEEAEASADEAAPEEGEADAADDAEEPKKE